ncbi:hypothetical protein Droror1_Dr00017196 [Drosera rotundifolia]
MLSYLSRLDPEKPEEVDEIGGLATGIFLGIACLVFYCKLSSVFALLRQCWFWIRFYVILCTTDMPIGFPRAVYIKGSAVINRRTNRQDNHDLISPFRICFTSPSALDCCFLFFD